MLQSKRKFKSHASRKRKVVILMIAGGKDVGGGGDRWGAINTSAFVWCMLMFSQSRTVFVKNRQDIRSMCEGTLIKKKKDPEGLFFFSFSLKSKSGAVRVRKSSSLFQTQLFCPEKWTTIPRSRCLEFTSIPAHSLNILMRTFPL